ncbi:hypothetical protein [Pseudomarimonas arenosa]|uniref:Uncharacterized protein n=1 Tax=Pseudomarimonas arenosa TaxID=2774145 RepID=A0AAW3ZL11_9GAMM|nr:hypothetical protein [Pseudomarimonas arenosa]MBD8526418.1 hypothetical protein [Pseudomarimonas arenosa]
MQARTWLHASALLLSAPAHAHGPTIEAVYLLAAVYLLPYLIGWVISGRGTRWRFLVCCCAILALGWLTSWVGTSTGTFFSLAAVAYFLPWLLLPLSVYLRRRQRRATELE